MCIVSARDGKNLMIDIGKSEPDFNAHFTNQTNFKADLVFNHDEWHKPENHTPFVTEEDKMANDEHSEEGYEFNENTTLTIVSTA